ncbi:uncharacterized protein B0T23DRAFT_17194 [Neurospora hispaniola]|uniref:AA1-like domain-containing protein n=1 Tax=Neurospora hispaniola TaxID=588809 RepID=A0AAJ0MV84_9PEZI|nr:hypothetical protein B0T23DRAFT_17194 [Neurospora hispaniola]
MLTTTLTTALAALLLPFSSASPIAARQDNTTTSTPPTNQTSCGATSFGNFSWALSAFDYHASYIYTNPAHQNSWGYVNFNLTNPAIGPSVTTVCSASSNQLNDFFYGTVQYTCTNTPAGVKSDVGKTKFDFNRPTGELRFNQSWTCRDGDPNYPTTFTGYAAVKLHLNCTEARWQNRSWKQGQIYSTRDVRCSPVNLSVDPKEMTAMA